MKPPKRLKSLSDDVFDWLVVLAPFASVAALSIIAAALIIGARGG